MALTIDLASPCHAPRPPRYPGEAAIGTPALVALTPREREVLALLCERLTNRRDRRAACSSARAPSKATSPVILGKLGVANRREAAALAARFRAHPPADPRTRTPDRRSPIPYPVP